MKPSTKKKLARNILSHVAVTMLMDDESVKSPVQAALQKRYTQLVSENDKEAVKQILNIKNIIIKLTDKLMNCENPEMIAQVAAVINGLNTGDVHIAAEGQEFIEV